MRGLPCEKLVMNLRPSIRLVDQTRFGHPGGNCYEACLATILCCAIDDVPILAKVPEGQSWFRVVQRWLSKRDYCVVNVYLKSEQIDHDGRCRENASCIYPPNFPLICSGRSPRGNFLHSIVAYIDEYDRWRTAHDPHPSRDGLASYFEEIDFLIPRKSL